MSGYAYEDVCENCGGMIHVSTDTRDPNGNYSYCLDCGKGTETREVQWTLAELNEERETWELPPLTELKEKN